MATWLDETGYQTKYLGKYLNGYKGPTYREGGTNGKLCKATSKTTW